MTTFTKLMGEVSGDDWLPPEEQMSAWIPAIRMAFRMLRKMEFAFGGFQDYWLAQSDKVRDEVFSKLVDVAWQEIDKLTPETAGICRTVPVQVARFEPGDIAVLSYPMAVSRSMAVGVTEVWEETMKRCGKDVPLIVLDSGGKLAVMKTGGKSDGKTAEESDGVTQ